MMKKLSIFIVSVLILCSVQTVHAQVVNNLWKVTSNILAPVLSSWGIQIPSLGSSASPCVYITDAQGDFGTKTCGGGGPSSATTTITDGSATSTGPNFVFSTTTTGTDFTVTSNGARTVNFNLPFASPTANGKITSANYNQIISSLSTTTAAATYQPIGDYVTHTYASSTFPSFTYASSTFQTIGDYVTHAYASSTFQVLGNYITALTGDVTASGPGSVAATIGANKVTYGKIQQEAAGTLLGNPTNSTANVTEVGLGSGLAFNATFSGSNLFVTSAIKSPCAAATTTSLNATYSNGTAGVGATLTNAGTQAALVIDGYSVAVNDRILIAGQLSATSTNGIYSVTTVGDGTHNWVLTRTIDFDGSATGPIIAGSQTTIIQGTVNKGITYIESAAGPFTVGTTPITFIAGSAGSSNSVAWGAIVGTLSSQGDLQSALNAKFNLVGSQSAYTSGLINASTTLTTSATTTNLAVSSLTNGSVVYATSSGAISQDNTNFFWDGILHRLGIGTNAPAAQIDVKTFTESTDVVQSVGTVGQQLGAYSNGHSYQYAQSFTPTINQNMTAIGTSFNSTNGSPTGQVLLTIETDSAGTPSGTLVNANASTTFTPVQGTLNKTTFPAPFSLTAGTKYWIHWSTTAAQTTGNWWTINSSSANPYPSYDLYIKQDAGSWAVITNTDARFQTYYNSLTANNDALAVTSGGKVGIDAGSSPLNSLDVQGTADITGNAGFGGQTSPSYPLDIFAQKIEMASTTDSFVEFRPFSGNSDTRKVSFGALGNIEANVSYNMDYTQTGTHAYYDPNFPAVWNYMNSVGWGVQFAPTGYSNDIWTNSGKKYLMIQGMDGRLGVGPVGDANWYTAGKYPAHINSFGSTTLSTSPNIEVYDSNGSTTAIIDDNGQGNFANIIASTTATSTFAGAIVDGPTKSIIDQENTLATSTSMTIDWNAGNQQLVRAGTSGITFSFINYQAGQNLKIVFCNPPSGTVGTITWPAIIDWPGQTTPGQTTTAKSCDAYTFIATNATGTLTVLGNQISGY